jgi:hypothetical protein
MFIRYIKSFTREECKALAAPVKQFIYNNVLRPEFDVYQLGKGSNYGRLLVRVMFQFIVPANARALIH